MLVPLACIVLGAALSVAPSAAAGRAGTTIVPIHGTIDEGMAHMTARSLDSAAAAGDRAVLLDVDTFGGLVSAATEIRDAALHSRVPVYAYVSGRAWSAGALITLSAERIAMAPGSSIGAAEPIPKSIKTVSALRGEFTATAAERHRNPQLAAAMVDAGVDAPGYKARGAILTLTGREAVEAHVADAVAATQDDALARFGLRGTAHQAAGYTLGEQLARFATDPAVSGLLLSLGFVGLLLEMQTLHGIAGLIGLGGFGLFFGSHWYAGFSDSLVLGLAALGLLGILLELHVLPGHGIAGSLGVVALIAAVVLAFGLPFVFVAVQAIAIAIVLSALLFVGTSRVFPRNAFVQRMALTAVQGRDYVASSDQRTLLGRRGTAVSYLRPAGVAAIDDRRVDVLTEGEFLPAGTPVVVTRVEGARVFVRSETA